MTLEEAIKLNNELLRTGNYDVDPKFTKAIKLGIEALKFRQRWEARRAQTKFPLLPGETYIPESVGKLPSDE